MSNGHRLVVIVLATLNGIWSRLAWNQFHDGNYPFAAVAVVIAITSLLVMLIAIDDAVSCAYEAGRNDGDTSARLRKGAW